MNRRNATRQRSLHETAERFMRDARAIVRAAAREPELTP